MGQGSDLSFEEFFAATDGWLVRLLLLGGARGPRPATASTADGSLPRPSHRYEGTS